MSFANLGVPEDLLAVLRQRGFEQPFPIQTATIPDALAGHDVCGRAPTGSGKTLAFGLAAVARTPRAKPGRPTALVLLPTRELAAQVVRELAPIAAARAQRVTAIYGGVGYHEQRRSLRRGVDILVACPGRLEDLVEQGDVALGDVSFAVVDEADRMADMGFLPAVRRLLDATRPDRQTLLFSATLDNDVAVLVKRYQSAPRRHEVETSEELRGDVRHLFWKVPRHERLDLTAKLVMREWPAIVFCRTRHGADRLAKQLTRAGVSAAPIHGSRTQPQRDQALAAFSSGRVQALVATDVAARGIHVDDVSCVLHFDPPGTAKDYVHRSGRTGRAGADGIVVSLVDVEQVKDVLAMQRELGTPNGVHAADLGSLTGSTKPAPPVPEAQSATRPAPNARPYNPTSAGGRNGGRSGRKPARSRRRRGRPTPA